MPNRFFNNLIDLINNTRARASDVEANFDQVEDGFDTVQSEIDLKAPAADPTFTGVPRAPTAVAGTNTSQIATTAFVHAERTNTATLTGKTISLANNTLQATSAQLAAALSDETGTGQAVFSNAPALTNPTITGGTISGVAITASTIDGTAVVNVQRLSGNGVTTAFILTGDPASENNTQVFVNGVYQQKDTYSLVGTTLTFTEAPPAGTENIEVSWTSIYQIGVTSSDLVNYQPAGTGAVATSVETKLREFVSVKDRGAVGDGVVDDTTAVTAAHVYANSIGAMVSYKGCVKVALQANAQIPVKTSVDFENCEIVILGGVVGSPAFPIPNTVYVVSDDACPLTTVTGAVSASNLTKGALFPTLGLFDGHGYALLECALQVPNRAETGTVNYTQAFKINRLGRASQPLSTDISAHAAAITVSYRRTSQKRLTISNFTLVEGTWNNQCVFDIQRCNVKVSGASMMFVAPGATFNNVCAIVRVSDASDVYVEDFVTTGRPVTATNGSYSLAVEGGADIFVDRMNALTGWGATGCNNINGMYYNRCVLNRVDVHASAHNVFVEDCDIHEAGMVYGWGGGTLSMKNSRLHRCPAIASRPDYGNTFFGDLIVDGCEAESNITATYYVVDLLTNPIGASTAIYAPETITVQNFRRVGRASANNSELIPVAIQIKDASSVVYAPSSIKVHNIGCHPSWRFGLRLDWLNMESNPSTFGLSRIEFSEIYPNVAATTSTGILDLTSIRTPTTAVQPVYVGNNCENIRLLCRSAGGAQVYLSHMSLNGVEFDSGAATQPRCHISDCRFSAPATGYANPSPLAPVGGTRTGANNYTSVVDSVFTASNIWNLANVSAAQGVLITTGSQTPALPAAQTPTTMFDGYRAAGAFQT